ncbi:MAG: SDR family NAD(P)-dependent oxidoreductase [Candidatus Lokiarchaeota archaeon]|nr:SDR family NAD(P)-dependent oxidoreductase [Candidatus Lokiarchaeota archaeon]
MSIIILGACGEIGRYIALDLVNSGFDVVLADIREPEGNQLAKKLGSRATFHKLDVMDFNNLVEVLKNYKLVVNNVGPYYMFGDWIPKAAIQAGINYIDICDDHDATLNFLNLDKVVQREGLTFLINSGASAGLTNIMAKLGAEQLDKVESIRVLWFEDTGETIGFGQLAHWAHIAMGKVPQFINGKLAYTRALTDREIVKFPAPLGSVPLYYVGHPEPITLPRYIETNEAICKGGILPESDILLTKILDKLIPVKDIKIMKLIVKFFLRILPLISGKVEEREIISAFRSDVIGIKNQKKAHLSNTVVGPVAKLTSIPASIIAQMIINSDIKSQGVFPPEGCSDLNLEQFKKELKKRNVHIMENHY